MNNNVFCPDCNSQDVQEIIKTEHSVTNNRNWKGFWLVIVGGGILCAVLGGILESPGFAAVFWFIVFPLSIFILRKHNAKIEDKSSCHYVCRSCGREFK